jgi:nucleobase:cation symporter-1, NCS1 family
VSAPSCERCNWQYLLLLLYFIIPWTAINLVDFYFVRRGRYSIPDLFSPRSRYGLVNWVTIAIYVVVMGVEVPFMNTTGYTGPIAKSLGGADLTWIVGLLLAGSAYYVIGRRLWGSDASEPMVLPSDGAELAAAPAGQSA